MNAQELFQEVVLPNYREFTKRPTDIRLLWNALISMNSVADYLALERLGYRKVSRQTLQDEADDIREQHDLDDLQLCADTLKHLRKTGGSRGNPTVTATSTDVSSDQATWEIYNSRLVDVLERAFEKLKDIPELR